MGNSPDYEKVFIENKYGDTASYMVRDGMVPHVLQLHIDQAVKFLAAEAGSHPVEIDRTLAFSLLGLQQKED